MPGSSRRAALIATLVALVAAGVLVAALAGRPVSTAALRRPCGARTDATYLASARAVAQRIAAQEHAGGAVDHTLATVRKALPALARDVGMRDPAALRRAILVLLYNGEHIVRLRVVHAGHVLIDIGSAQALQPITVPLSLRARHVGTLTFAIQDDMGYMLLARRLDDVRVVMRAGAGTVMSDIAPGPGPLPARGRRRIAGQRYLIASLRAARFPSGSLAITLFVPEPPRLAAGSSCAAVRAQQLLGVARRVYEAALTGPSEFVAHAVVAGSAPLHRAMLAGHAPTARRVVRGLVASGRMMALEVRAGGRLLAGAASADGAIAPVSWPLRGRGGKVVGRYVLGVENAARYLGIAGSLIQQPVLVRSGPAQLAGAIAGPARLPQRGITVTGGTAYAVASFSGARFPAGPLRIYVLVPAS